MKPGIGTRTPASEQQRREGGSTCAKHRLGYMIWITCRQPMKPGTGPSTPASEQRLQASACGATGYRHR